MTTNLDHLERLRAEATEGPVYVWPDHHSSTRPEDTYDVFLEDGDGYPIASNTTFPMAAWITAITNAAPELLAEVRELRATVALLNQEIAECDVLEVRAERERLASELKSRGLAHVVTRGGAA